MLLTVTKLNDQTQSSYTRTCSTQNRNWMKTPWEFVKNSGVAKKHGNLTFRETFETKILKIIKIMLTFLTFLIISLLIKQLHVIMPMIDNCIIYAINLSKSFA